MRIQFQRRLCNYLLRMTVDASRDKIALSAIPLGQDFRRRGTSQNSGVNQAGKSHSRNVSTGAVYAIKVPDGLGSFRIVLVEKATAVFPVKDSGESPWRVLEWLDIRNVYNQEIARLSTFDFEGTS